MQKTALFQYRSNPYSQSVTATLCKPPFGMLIKERTYSSNAYRFGFNGKEKVDEVNGEGNNLDFGARIYDSRLGRFLTIDPLQRSFPSFTNYSISECSPIKFIDYLGYFKLEKADFESNTAKLEEYNYIQNDIAVMLTNELFSDHIGTLGHLSNEDLVKIFTGGEGPTVIFTDNFESAVSPKGEYSLKDNSIKLNMGMLTSYVEAKTIEDKEAALLSIISTIAHETVHYGRDQYYDPDNDQKSKDDGYSLSAQVKYLSGDESENYQFFVTDNNSGEAGSVFSRTVYGNDCFGYDPENQGFDKDAALAAAKTTNQAMKSDSKRVTLIPKVVSQ